MKITKSERLAVGLLQAQMPLPKSVRLLGILLPRRRRPQPKASSPA